MEVPKWVPSGFKEEYLNVAMMKGETEAARWAREAKRDMER